jgi:type IV pilus assembly protein PilN
MARINLLPWRENLREKRKKQFFSISTLVAIFAGVIAFLVYVFYAEILDDQRQANQIIVTENQKLDRQLKALDGLQLRRDEILQRMKLIQDLQTVRPVVVHIFDEILKVTPKNMYLTSFSRAGDQFTLEGKAQDPNIVSEFLRNLGASSWFRNAFMKSFVTTEPKQQQQGAVSPRPEDSYGVFVVTVDLGNQAQVLGDAPQQKTAEVTP